MKVIDFHECGEEFEHDGRRFVAVCPCNKCDLADECLDAKLMSCCFYDRKDHREVIYKEVGKKKKISKTLFFMFMLMAMSFLASMILTVFVDDVFVKYYLQLFFCVFMSAGCYVVLNGQMD